MNFVNLNFITKSLNLNSQLYFAYLNDDYLDNYFFQIFMNLLFHSIFT